MPDRQLAVLIGEPAVSIDEPAMPDRQLAVLIVEPAVPNLGARGSDA
jgi:hypothetical protein